MPNEFIEQLIEAESAGAEVTSEYICVGKPGRVEASFYMVEDDKLYTKAQLRELCEKTWAHATKLAYDAGLEDGTTQGWENARHAWR